MTGQYRSLFAEIIFTYTEMAMKTKAFTVAEAARWEHAFPQNLFLMIICIILLSIRDKQMSWSSHKMKLAKHDKSFAFAAFSDKS